MQIDEMDILIYYSIIIAGQRQCLCEAVQAPYRRFYVQTCFYMPDLFIPLFIFHTVSIFTILMVNSYVMH